MGYRYTENREHWPSNDKLYQETKKLCCQKKSQKQGLWVTWTNGKWEMDMEFGVYGKWNSNWEFAVQEDEP